MSEGTVIIVVYTDCTLIGVLYTISFKLLQLSEVGLLLSLFYKWGKIICSETQN